MTTATVTKLYTHTWLSVTFHICNTQPMLLSWFVLLSPLNQQDFYPCHISAKLPWAQWPQTIYGCVLSAFILGLCLGSAPQINLFCYLPPTLPPKRTLCCDVFFLRSLLLLVGAYRHNIWWNTWYCSLLNFGKIHVEIWVKLTSALCFNGASQMVLVVKNPPTNEGNMGWEALLEEGMATYSNILAWRIPWTEEPGGLQSTGLHRIGHDWSDLALSTFLRVL